MSRHFEKRVLPYTAEQMYALVADFERYPEFLPWCRRCEVVERKRSLVKAVMDVGNKSFHDSFTSWVSCDPYRAIKVTFAGGALESLTNEWTFAPGRDGLCEVTFFVDFKIKSKILGAMMELFFDQIFGKMVEAFERRAADLYGVNDGYPNQFLS